MNRKSVLLLALTLIPAVYAMELPKVIKNMSPSERTQIFDNLFSAEPRNFIDRTSTPEVVFIDELSNGEFSFCSSVSKDSSHNHDAKLRAAIEKLIKEGGNLDALICIHIAEAPLLKVAWDENTSDLLELLLNNGANPNIRSELSTAQGALDRAVGNEPNVKGVIILLQHGAKPNFFDEIKPYRFPIAQAVHNYYQEEKCCQQFSLNNYSKEYSLDKKNKFKQIIIKLLEYGADPYLKGIAQESAMDIAQENNLLDIIDLLERGPKYFIDKRYIAVLNKAFQNRKFHLPLDVAKIIVDNLNLYSNPKAYTIGKEGLQKLKLRNIQQNTN